MPVTKIPENALNPLNTENHHKLQLKERVDENGSGLSFEGLPKGSCPGQVVRCIRLLEHVGSCRGGDCPEGGECRRTRQVLTHHLRCRVKLRCNVCLQLRALCRNHSDHCQKDKQKCDVPYCKNKKILPVPTTNKVKVNSTCEQPSEEDFNFVLKKISEAMVLPNKQQKLQGIGKLLETNRHGAIRVLWHFKGGKQKPQTAFSSVCQPQIRGLLTDVKSKETPSSVFDAAKPTNLKLDVIVKVLDKNHPLLV